MVYSVSHFEADHSSPALLLAYTQLSTAVDFLGKDVRVELVCGNYEMLSHYFDKCSHYK